MLSWLAFAFALEVGMLPMGTMVMYEPPPIIARDLAGDFYTTLEADVGICDTLWVGGSVKTFVSKHGTGRNFYPTQMGYEFRVRLVRGPLEVGFRHYCTHPVVPYLPVDPTGRVNWEGAYEEVYVRMALRTR